MALAQITGHPVRLQLDSALDDLSGTVKIGDYLLLGNDEGHQVLVCRAGEQADTWEVVDSLALSDSKQETDIEAMTYADGLVYVVGSHSLRRRSLKPATLSVKKNRKRFARVEAQKNRNVLYRLSFDKASGRFGEPESISLAKRLRKDPFLGPFTHIASKENGVDIEGLAVHQGRLYAGFRGPVLRDNLVPVMVFEFDRPKDYELRFVDLRGQGIRDMVSLGNMLLLLTGPVGDAPGPFRIWLWDGKDQIPGADRYVLPAKRLGNISVPLGAKAEGLALLNDEGDEVELLVVVDGVDGVDERRAQRLRITVPSLR